MKRPSVPLWDDIDKVWIYNGVAYKDGAIADNLWSIDLARYADRLEHALLPFAQSIKVIHPTRKDLEGLALVMYDPILAEKLHTKSADLVFLVRDVRNAAKLLGVV